VRWGQIYGIDVQDHQSWMGNPDHARLVRNDYIGQTRQKRRARENQHRDDKPWEDLIVGSPRVLWEGWCTNEQLDEMERQFIQDVPLEQRPRLNYLLNEGNPRRIPKYTQVEQRHARDARRGETPWQPTPYRAEAYGYAPASARANVRQVRKPWTRGRKHLLGWSITYATLALTGWILLAAHHQGGWKQTGTASAILSMIVVCLLARWVWLGCPVTKEQRRRVKKRRAARKWRR